MALGGSVSLGEGGAPAISLFCIPHSRLHQLLVNECYRDVTTTADMVGCGRIAEGRCKRKSKTS